MNKKQLLSGKYTDKQINDLIADLRLRLMHIKFVLDDINKIRTIIYGQNEFIKLKDAEELIDSMQFREMHSNLTNKHPRHRQTGYNQYNQITNRSDKLNEETAKIIKELKVLLPRKIHIIYE